MCMDVSDRTLIRQLRQTRYGSTGFHCVHCGCLEGREIKGRPRSQRCTSCLRQQSVTAGTPLHGSKMPLKVWLVRGGHYEAGLVPTGTQLAEELGVSRSTAWHLNHRFLRALYLGRATMVIGQLLLPIACRRPRGTDSDHQRPSLLREILARFADQPRGQALITFTSLTFEGDRPQLTHVAMSADQQIEARKNPTYRSPVVTRPLSVWLAYHLERKHQRVCLRWLSRYLDHYLGIYAVASDWVSMPDWWHRLAAGARRNLAELRAEPREPEPRFGVRSWVLGIREHSSHRE